MSSVITRRNLVTNPRGRDTDGTVVVVEGFDGDTSPDPDLELVDGDLVAPAPVGWAVGGGGVVYYSASRDMIALRAIGEVQTVATFTDDVPPEGAATAVAMVEGAPGDEVAVFAGFVPTGETVTLTDTVQEVRATGNSTEWQSGFALAGNPEVGATAYFRMLATAGEYDGDYFDGDTPERIEDHVRYTYGWEGEPHASVSYEMVTDREGIRVEPGFHNAPFAGINVTGLDPSEPSVINLWRSVPGEPRSIVQGAREMRVTAAAFVEDWGVPLGRPVTYTLEVVSGSVEPELLTDTITIESDTAWLQDPLNPVTAVPVVGGNRIPGRRDSFLTGASFTELVRELPDELHYPIGATLGVSLGGQRRAPSRIPLTVLTQAAQEAALLRTLLETAHPIMLRTPPNVDQIPAVTYLRVEAAEQPVTTFLGGEVTRWVMTADTVRGPSVSVLVPRWTYGDVQALYGTYGEVIDGRRYLDWVRDPEALGSLSARSTTMRAGGD